MSAKTKQAPSKRARVTKAPAAKAPAKKAARVAPPRAADPAIIPPSPVTPPVTATTPLQDKLVLLIMTLHSPGNARTVSDKSILTTEADKGRLNVRKRLIEAPEHKMLQVQDGGIRAYVRGIALPSPFKEGVHAVPLALLDQVDRRLQSFSDERPTLVAALQLTYAAAKDVAREKLGPLYRESDYLAVGDLPEAYRMEWQYVSLAAPDAMRSVDTGLFRREQQRLQQQWDDAIGTMREALRVGLAELIDDMVARLTKATDTADDGSPRRFKPTKLLDRFNEFLATFDARNVTNDFELTALAERARKILNGVDTATLIESTTLKTRVRADFAVVKAELDRLDIESGARRRIRFDDAD